MAVDFWPLLQWGEKAYSKILVLCINIYSYEQIFQSSKENNNLLVSIRIFLNSWEIWDFRLLHYILVQCNTDIFFFFFSQELIDLFFFMNSKYMSRVWVYMNDCICLNLKSHILEWQSRPLPHQNINNHAILCLWWLSLNLSLPKCKCIFKVFLLF